MLSGPLKMPYFDTVNVARKILVRAPCNHHTSQCVHLKGTRIAVADSSRTTLSLEFAGHIIKTIAGRTGEVFEIHQFTITNRGADTEIH